MTVSIMLTSCGKSAGLSNGGKKAGNKSPAFNANTKSQLQKNNEAGNKTLANDTSTKNLPQKIDNNIKQSRMDYVKDNIFVIAPIAIIVGAIVVGFIVWIIKNKSPQTTEPEKQSEPLKPPDVQPEAGGLSQAIEQPEPSQIVEQNEHSVLDVRPFDLNGFDYKVSYLTFPFGELERLVKRGNVNEKRYAIAELERRMSVLVFIPEDINSALLTMFSLYENKALFSALSNDSLSLSSKKAIRFILKVRKAIE
jgi:hypothetical protein